ncbi:WxL domain-containing protein [Gottschalkia purinilytica]|uniref:WxL domain-containing protein n=1 Tax=Gottschalkia purinilytica TaxID=1503 RepID=UPI00067D6663|nr:WxL domain-containing protein [Gottschalkia purinilytica]
MKIINGPGRADRPCAISMKNNSKISVQKNAVLDIEIQEDKVGDGWLGSPIYMEGNSQFLIDDGGSFYLDVKGTTPTSGSAIRNTGAGTFKVGKNATFKITSDMTDPNDGLIYMGVGSKFQFSDAKKIDLELTDPTSPSPLIQMPSGEWKIDVQRVYQWNKGNVTESPNHSWTPIFGMTIPYSHTTVGNIKAQSVDEETLNDFKQHFNSTKAQRITFERIPDFNIKITNTLCDNPKKENSYTVIGETIPNAYVRLSGGSFTEKDNKILSPVRGEDIPKTISDNFTVKADDKGHFKYTLSPTRSFIAGDEISAFAFNEGKYAEYSTHVIDLTPPSGNGQKVETSLKDTIAPELSKFIIDEYDTNPNNKKINYLWSDTNTNDLKTMLKQEGVYEVYIVLEDDNGNKSQPIESELVVHATAGEICATDIGAKLSTVKSMSREEFRKFILSESKLKAWYLSDFKYHDGGKYVEIRNFDQIKQETGNYVVELFLSKDLTKQPEDILKKIELTIGDYGPTPPVNPEEPGGKAEDTENNGTGQQGLLRIDYVPSTFDFGSIPFSYGSRTVHALEKYGQKGKKIKQWIQISDERNKSEGWKVVVSLNETFKSESGALRGAELIIPKGKVYSSLGDVAIKGLNSQSATIGLGEGKTIFSSDNGYGKGTSTNVWDPSEVSLKLPGGEGKTNQVYEASIDWTLLSAPDN